MHFGQPGASHMHDFYGNVAEDAFSTVDAMVGQATTCKTPADPSGYWVPTTLINGVPLKPIRVITYWEAPANQNVETIPSGIADDRRGPRLDGASEHGARGLGL